MNEPAVANSSERYGWYIVFVLSVCGVVAYIDRQIINLLVDGIKGDLLITDTQISLLQGFAFAVFYAVVAIPLGRLADSKNRRWLITIGIIAWTIAAMACGLANSYAELFIARVFVGIGEAVLTPAGFSLLADLFKPKRLARPVSVFTASSFIGSGVALIVGGAIIKYLTELDAIVFPIVGQLEVWQAAFILGALPGIPAALWFFFTTHEPVRQDFDQHRQASAEFRDGFFQALKYCRKNLRLFTALFAGISILSAAQFALGAWTPSYFMRVFDWSAAEIGSAQGTLFLICGTTGVITGGFLTDFFHRRGKHDANLRVATYAAFLAVPCAILATSTSNPQLAIAMLAPTMFLGTIPFGSGPAAIPTVAPPQYRAQLVAIYLLIANLLGQSGGPWVVALMTDSYFGSDLAVGKSLSIVVPSLLVLGGLLTMFGWAPLQEQLKRMNDEVES